MIIKKFDAITPRDRVLFGIAIGLMVFGSVLLMIGLLAEPQGVIDKSVLIAYGEIATFAAAILGIDSVATNKLQQIVAELRKEGKDKVEEQSEKQ